MDDVFKDLALHGDVAHQTCGLKILVKDDALETHLVFVFCFLRVVVALVSADQVEQDDTQVVADVLVLFVSHDLVEAGEHDLRLLKQLNQVPQ